MFEVHNGATSSPPPLARRPEQLHVLEAVTRELMPAVWAMGVTCSALRLPPDLTRREREFVEVIERGLGRIVRTLSGVHDLVLLERQGELQLDPGPSLLASICEDAIAQVREAGVAAVVRCTHEGEGEGAWDGERLAQAISYLVECAAGAAPVEDPEVRLHWKGGAREVLLVVERSAGSGDRQDGIDLEWGGAVEGNSESGVRGALARAIVLGHGGSLARFASACNVAYVVCLPRRASGELN